MLRYKNRKIKKPVQPRAIGLGTAVADFDPGLLRYACLRINVIVSYANSSRRFH